ncbi:MAG TPA: hypothetical protein VK031_07720, partial [Tissierellaceae bacterium]|nr:hypothetical protein [Tissierellaceae bacterium]
MLQFRNNRFKDLINKKRWYSMTGTSASVKIREIEASQITEEVKRLCVEANYFLPEDVVERLEKMKEEDGWDLSKATIDKI